MTTTPNLPPSLSDPDNQLEDMLARLARAYRQQDIPPEALERLERRFQQENRQLSEQDLQWLAAAGAVFPLSDLKERP